MSVGCQSVAILIVSLPTVKGIDVKENNAYATAICTVPAAPVSSQHEEIVRVAVEDQNNYSAWLTK